MGEGGVIQEYPPNCSLQDKRIREDGFRSRRHEEEANIKQRHRTARLRWANPRVYMNRVRWQTVIFSDKSRFRLSRSDSRMRVYRH